MNLIRQIANVSSAFVFILPSSLDSGSAQALPQVGALASEILSDPDLRIVLDKAIEQLLAWAEATGGKGPAQKGTIQ